MYKIVTIEMILCIPIYAKLIYRNSQIYWIKRINMGHLRSRKMHFTREKRTRAQMGTISWLYSQLKRSIFLNSSYNLIYIIRKTVKLQGILRQLSPSIRRMIIAYHYRNNDQIYGTGCQIVNQSLMDLTIFKWYKKS